MGCYFVVFPILSKWHNTPDINYKNTGIIRGDLQLATIGLHQLHGLVSAAVFCFCLHDKGVVV